MTPQQLGVPLNAQGITRLLGSSKGLVFLGVMTAGMVLVLTGKLDAESVYNKIINLSMIFFPAVAAEDIARNMATRPPTPGVQQNVNMPTIPPPAPAAGAVIMGITGSGGGGGSDG